MQLLANEILLEYESPDNSERLQKSEVLNGFLAGEVIPNSGHQCFEFHVSRFDRGQLLADNTLIPAIAVAGQKFIHVQSYQESTRTIHNRLHREFVENISDSSEFNPCLVFLPLEAKMCVLSDGNTYSTSFGKLDWYGLSPTAKFKAVPILALSVVRTALYNRMCTQHHVLQEFETGYITLNEQRHAIFILENDPAAATIPLVGIYVSGAGSLKDPRVAASCLRYISVNHLTDRVYMTGRHFLLAFHSSSGGASRLQWFEICCLSDDFFVSDSVFATHQITLEEGVRHTGTIELCLTSTSSFVNSSITAPHVNTDDFDNDMDESVPDTRAPKPSRSGSIYRSSVSLETAHPLDLTMAIDDADNSNSSLNIDYDGKSSAVSDTALDQVQLIQRFEKRLSNIEAQLKSLSQNASGRASTETTYAYVDQNLKQLLEDVNDRAESMDINTDSNSVMFNLPSQASNNDKMENNPTEMQVRHLNDQPHLSEMRHQHNVLQQNDSTESPLSQTKARLAFIKDRSLTSSSRTALSPLIVDATEKKLVDLENKLKQFLCFTPESSSDLKSSSTSTGAEELSELREADGSTCTNFTENEDGRQCGSQRSQPIPSPLADTIISETQCNQELSSVASQPKKLAVHEDEPKKTIKVLPTSTVTSGLPKPSRQLRIITNQQSTAQHQSHSRAFQPLSSLISFRHKESKVKEVVSISRLRKNRKSPL